MSKIALIGASGYVGSAVLAEAAKRGHQVTALVRHPEKIKQDSYIQAVKADVLQTDALASLLIGHDIVIAAYSPGSQEPDLRNVHIKGSQSITKATKQAGIKRLIMVGGAGNLLINGVQLVDTADFPPEYKEGALGARQAYEDLKTETALDWSFVSPAIELVPGAAKGNFRLGKDQPVFDDNGQSSITVGDLAIAILDEAEQNQHIRQRFTAGY